MSALNWVRPLDQLSGLLFIALTLSKVKIINLADHGMNIVWCTMWGLGQTTVLLAASLLAPKKNVLV